MDYTNSNGFSTDAGTGNRMHLQAQAVPTAVTDLDMNSVIWSAMEVMKAAGLAGVQFDKANAATYTKLRDAINVMVRRQTGAVCAGAGTADAITGDFTPDVITLVDGMYVSVRAGASNATTTPTFKADGTALKTIVKGNNLPLAVGDIAGAGHWLELQYDLTMDKWVLLNPAVATAANDAAGADNGTRAASTGWVRNAMSAIAIAAGFASLLAASGYIKFPTWLGGLIIQWFQSSSTVSLPAGAAASASFTFPIAFPAAHYRSVAVLSDNSYGFGATVYCSGLTSSGGQANFWNATGSGTLAGAAATVISIGR